VTAGTKTFPRRLPKDASQQDVREYFADFLCWIREYQLTALIACGVTQSEIMAMKKIARAYRHGTENAATYADLDAICFKLETLDVRI